METPFLTKGTFLGQGLYIASYRYTNPVDDFRLHLWANFVLPVNLSTFGLYESTYTIIFSIFLEEVQRIYSTRR
jgi:hypothetical protein